MNETTRAALNVAIHIASLKARHPQINVHTPYILCRTPAEMAEALALACEVRLSSFEAYPLSPGRVVTLFWVHTTQAGNAYPCSLQFRC